MDGVTRRREMVQTGGASRPYGWLYHFNNNLLSSGTKDWSFSGVENYVVGEYGNAYYHKVDPEGSSNDLLGIKATDTADLPDFSGDWTLSYWHKSLSEKRGHPFSATKYIGTANATILANPSNVKSGWTVTRQTVPKSATGIKIGFESQYLYIRILNLNGSYGAAYRVTLPSSFSTLIFHHYALTQSRANGRLYFFVDGQKIFDIATNTTVLFGENIGVGNYFGTASGTQSTLQSTGYGDIVDDLFITDQECKWTADFDPTQIIY